MDQLSLPHLFQFDKVEIVYRNWMTFQNWIQILSLVTAYEVFRATWDQNQLRLMEQFRTLLLDRRNSCLWVSTIAPGGTTTRPADPKVILTTALKTNVSSIIPAHKHPSGNLQPSDSDRQPTRELKDAERRLHIAGLDHLIITPRDYKSSSDEGLMP